MLSLWTPRTAGQRPRFSLATGRREAGPAVRGAGRIFPGRASSGALDTGLELLAGAGVFRSGGCSNARH